MTEPTVTPLSLDELVAAQRQCILDRWATGARQLGRGAQLTEHELLDNMPSVLDALPAVAEQLRRGDAPTALDDYPDRHAATRLRQGYAVADVVAEYALLRRCTEDCCHVDACLSVAEQQLLDRAIDVATRQTVERFDKASTRLLSALDRVATLTLSDRSEDQILDELLAAMMTASSAIDSAVILLHESGRLTQRAAAGRAADRDQGFSIAVGDGFAGTIAASRQPLCLCDARNDPLVKSEVLRRAGIRALCGVPLVDGNTLLGVAHIGSTTVASFSHDEQVLFRTIAARVAAVLTNAKLVRELKLAVQERDAFLSIASHELNTPLTTLQLNVQALERRLQNPSIDAADLLRRVEPIGQQVERLARLVSNVLDLSRVRHQQLHLEPEPLDLGELVDEVVARMRALASRRGVELRLEQRAEVRGRWDRTRLEQVVSNLLSNAVKYGNQQPVDIVVDRRGSDAVLTVRDRGIGIAREQLPRIFVRFERLTDREQQHSLGLGLFIADQIVKAHGGQLEAASDGPNQGSTFTVVLPLEVKRAAHG